jgi:hypothetical protein
MTGIGKDQGRIERQARLRWVPLSRMRVNPLAQRDLNQARVAKLAAVFDPEKMDTPTVNYRGGPGQHARLLPRARRQGRLARSSADAAIARPFAGTSETARCRGPVPPGRQGLRGCPAAFRRRLPRPGARATSGSLPSSAESYAAHRRPLPACSASARWRPAAAAAPPALRPAA